MSVQTWMYWHCSRQLRGSTHYSCQNQFLWLSVNPICFRSWPEAWPSYFRLRENLFLWFTKMYLYHFFGCAGCCSHVTRVAAPSAPKRSKIPCGHNTTASYMHTICSCTLLPSSQTAGKLASLKDQDNQVILVNDQVHKVRMTIVTKFIVNGIRVAQVM